MRQSVIFMFSGQGSHYYQMGRGLFEQNLVFQKWMLEGDRILSEMIGVSIIDQVYNNLYKKFDRFSRTLYTHPAIFLVEYALAQAVIDSGIEPDQVLGTSVGGFAAAALAGVMSFETALTAVVRQAEAIETLCPHGGMMAILDSADLYFEDSLLSENENLELAAINFPSHFVVSGKPESLSDAQISLKEKKITSQLLDVSHGFHSSLIDPAAATYKEFLNTLVLGKPQIPFISCSHTYTLASIPQNYFWEVVRAPVQFQKTIDALEEHAPYFYLDLGPAGTLATFVRYNLKNKSSGSKSLFVLNPFKDEVNIAEKLKDLIPAP
jgi:trans-AT polyketide synthase/acyltransferase/oxidoreductase domain-containing protein